MKILYCPILESGSNHQTAAINKRGLYAALVNAGHWVTQYDYLAHVPSIEIDMQDLMRLHQPDMVFTQLHGADVIKPAFLEALRGSYPNSIWINWSGDSWLHSLTAAPMIELLRHVDLQLVAAPDVLPEYERLGIRAGFWQIAHEAPVGELPDMPAYDIVFLGNVINEKRRAMLEMLRSLPYKVGIYGDWEHADGRNTYDFGAGEALYKKARIAIADNVYQDQSNYISNRPIQIMMAGGAICLHQHVDKMKELSYGWEAGKHYVEWRDLDDLCQRIDEWLDPYMDRWTIVHDAKEHVEQHHTYDARVRQLFEDYLPALSR